MDNTDPDGDSSIVLSEARLLHAFLPAHQQEGHNTNTTVPAWVQSTSQFQAFITRVDRATERFDCGNGVSIPLTAVNDGFCDCLPSAVDEPGTAACSGQAPSAAGPGPSFLCRVGNAQSGSSSKNRVRGGPIMPSLWGVANGGADDGGLPPDYMWLPASKVGDGIVDCACGEDEGYPLLWCEDR